MVRQRVSRLPGMLFAVLAVCGCGEDAQPESTSGSCAPDAGTGSIPDFPAGEPTCPDGSGNMLKLRGTIGSTSISLERSAEKAYGGFANSRTGGGFQSPFVTDEAELFVGFRWDVELAPDVVGDIAGGFIIVPTGTPAAGTWVIEAGKLVFPSELSRGDVKFAIALVSGSDSCVHSASLSGCWADSL